MNSKKTSSLKLQRLSKRKPLSFVDPKTPTHVAVKKEIKEFSSRKKDHLLITLSESSQNPRGHSLDQVRLNHRAFPELNWQDISIKAKFLKTELSAPFFVSSMTAGSVHGRAINLLLAELSQEKRILMGVGSQRRELFDNEARKEWKELRKQFPKALLLSNIGLSQLIKTPVIKIFELCESLESLALIIHVNPLQECIQKEGTPYFRGGLSALKQLVKQSPIPVIVKEVGNGFSREDREQLAGTGIYALDLAGKGGTDWSRVEALRFDPLSYERNSGLLFTDWGYSLVDMLFEMLQEKVPYQVWGSGGIRNGLDVAKVVALGCELVGLAQPWLKSIFSHSPHEMKLKTRLDLETSRKSLRGFYEGLEKELKTAMFCTGSANLAQLKKGKIKWEGPYV